MTRLVVLLAAAGLALGAGACGKVQGNADAAVNGPDASTIDGNAGVTDASPDAQTSGPVTVHVLSLDNDNLPEPGATVLFYAPDGTLADRKLTDASGDATAELEAGGSITVVRLRANNTLFTTVAGVKPDETITVGRRESTSSELDGSMRVVLPTFGNATTYSMSLGCGGGSGQSNTFSVNLYGCGASADVMARTTISGSNYYLGKNDAAVAVDGVLDLSAEEWSFLSQTNFTVSLTNIPAGIDYLYASRYSLGQHGTIYSDGEGLQAPAAGSTAVAMGYPPGVGTATLVQIGLDKYEGKSPQTQRIAAKIDGVPSTHGVDLGTTLLPWVEQPVLDGAIVTWTGGAGGDAVIIDLNMYGSVQPYVGASWRLVLPPGTTSFTLPALPTDLDGRWNVADATYYGDTTIIELDQVDGYEQFRPEMEPIVYSVYWNYVALFADAPAATAVVSTTFQGD